MLNERLLGRLKTMMLETNASDEMKQEHYRKHFDKSAGADLNYSSENYVFIVVAVATPLREVSSPKKR